LREEKSSLFPCPSSIIVFRRVATYPPNVKYESIFIEAQGKARMERKGFWDSVFYGRIIM